MDGRGVAAAMLSDYLGPRGDGERVLAIDPRPLESGPGAVADLARDGRFDGFVSNRRARG